MSINSELKKEGIEVIKKINTLKVNSIAANITKKLVENFPEQNFNYNELFSKLSRVNMYVAKIPSGVAAKYFYKNSSIYFGENVDLNNLNSVVLHECIHAIQTKLDERGKLVSLGLCNFNEIKSSAVALNEAAVQLMTMKCNKAKFDIVKYFDLEISSNSPDYYPLECNLIRQMAYITGEYVLYNSTLNGTDEFKNKFITLTSKETYEKVKDKLNTIMYLEDELNSVLELIKNNELATKKVCKLVKRSNLLKEQIKFEFLTTQNRIITSFFDNQFECLYTPKSIENFRNALYIFRNFIGVADGYTFFNDYYIDKMAAIEEKYNVIQNKPLALIPIKDTLLAKIVRKIKVLTQINSNANTYNFDNINMK